MPAAKRIDSEFKEETGSKEYNIVGTVPQDSVYDCKQLFSIADTSLPQICYGISSQEVTGFIVNIKENFYLSMCFVTLMLD